MKKIVPMLLVMLLAFIISGCVNKNLSDASVSAASLLKIDKKPDTFSLKKARQQNQVAVDFADSKQDLMEGNSFLTYVEAAKIADEASRPLKPISNPADGNAGMPYVVANAAAGQLQSGLFNNAGSISAVNANSGLVTSGSSSNSASTLPVTSSDSSQSSSDGTTSSTISENSSVFAANSDDQALMEYFTDFQSYEQTAEPIMTQAIANPWSARDLVIDDQTLVSLLASSHSIFDFVRTHPSVTEGDAVLASVGDTLTVIYSLWGLGWNEAQTAYLMINIYYPNGSYVSHAQEGLSSL